MPAQQKCHRQTRSLSEVRALRLENPAKSASIVGAVTSASIGAALLKLFDARGLQVVGVRHIRLNRGDFIEAVKVVQARLMRHVTSVSIGIVFLGALGAKT